MRLLTVLLACSLATSAMAGETLIRHQGRLLDSTGTPISGTQSIRVSLYSDVSGTTPLWRQTFSDANLSQGYYALELSGLSVDGVTDLDDIVGADTLFLGIAVNGGEDMLPREQVSRSAFGRAGARGPVRALWSFEEASGTTSTDQSGEGNTLTAAGSGYAWTPLGHTGSAIQFTEAGGSFTAPSDSSLDIRDEVTLEAWVYRTGTEVNMPVVGKQDAYIMGVNNGQLQAAIWTDARQDWEWQGGGAVPLNEWTHIAVTYDGWAIRTFVNQELTSMVPYAHGTIGMNNHAVVVGSRSDQPTHFFSGRIDDVKISAVAKVYQSAGMTGMVAMFAGTECPAGWLKANGATLDSATYPALYASIGNTYGGSAASFNLPDLRGEFLRAADDGRGVDSGRAIGSFQAQDWKSFWVAGYTSGSYTHSDVLIPKTGYNTTYPFGGKWEGPGNRLRFQWDTTSEVRPRNVALLSCIKH